MARKKRGRPVSGILVVDKPAGETSNAVLQRVKALYFAAKAGHTGSLDPLATGVLPICFGEATKFSQFLLDADKVYRAEVVFGISTNTGDADGEIRERRDAGELTAEQLEQALAGFRGELRQVPSMFSAIKKDGKPLYELARQGIEVEREARTVMVHVLELESFTPGAEARAVLRIHCSKGTYVRSIAEDLGEQLGCGGHVAGLRRLRAGPFEEGRAVSLDELAALREREAFAEMDDLLEPVGAALEDLPQLTLGEHTGYYLLRGQPVLVPRAPTEGWVVLSMEDGRFVGLGEILDDGRVAPRRLVAPAAR